MKIELVLKKEVPGKWKTLTASGSPFPSSQDDFLQHVSNLEYKDPQTFNTANFGGDIDAWYSDLYKKLFSKSAAGSSAVAATAPSKQLDTAPISQAPLAKSSGPAYPTSSKSGPKNWDNLDVDDDDEKDDNVDDFFKKLYKDADPDTRRAMMKSYTESNGTSLSTSWNEASIKTYKTEAPNGAEAKSWDA